MCYDSAMKEFANKLKAIRAEKNLSQQQVADGIGVTRAAYSNYEQGLREPDLDTLKKICLLFDTSADDLLDISIE